MAEVPQHHKLIAKHIASAWSGRPQIRLWSAESGSTAKLAIASLEGFPRPGSTAYSTIGLSDHGGYELATACLSKYESFVKALFDVGSFIMDGHRKCEPGATFEKVITRFYSRCNAGHFFLSPVAMPRLQIGDLAVELKNVRWLYGWPITSDELIALKDKGIRDLESRLEISQDIDLMDLDRNSLPRSIGGN